MTSIIVTPELERSIVTRRGIVTVPVEMATVSCNCVARKPCAGLVVDKLPLSVRELERHLRGMGDKFISRMRVRGYEWMGDIKLHGPFDSYEFNEHMANVESELWRRASRDDDPSHVLPLVFERNAASPYKDYLLVGDFLAKNVFTEVIVKEE